MQHHYYVLDLIGTQKSIVGSATGGRKDMIQMLNYCAINKIYPKVEVMKFDDIQKACEKLDKNQARYRIVLVNDENKDEK